MFKKAFCFVLLFAFACSYKPPDDPNARPGQGFNLFPVWYDNMLGDEYGGLYAHELPLVRNARIQDGVQDLGMHIVRTYYGSERPPFDFDFYVVDLDVINAFALPGGKIFVFRGLLQDLENESELAGVLAHEIGHVVARHGTKNLSKSVALQGGLLAATSILSKDHENLALATYIAGSVGISLRLLKYNRDYEREADWFAIHRVYQAGYDPNGMISLFKHFEGENGENSRAVMFLSSHPSPVERQKNVAEQLPRIDGPLPQPDVEQYAFATVRDELSAMPPAPKEIEGSMALSLTSLDSLGDVVANSRTSSLQEELRRTGTQTVTLYVPSNEEWTESGIQVKTGQRIDVTAEFRSVDGSTAPGSLKAQTVDGTEQLELFESVEGESIHFTKAGTLKFGVADSIYHDNAGWYVVTAKLYKR